MFQQISQEIESQDVSTITQERKALLRDFAIKIGERLEDRSLVNLNFVCTHNSRRSHLAQIWAQACAGYYGFSDVNCYSGGTEATRMYPMVPEVLETQGLQIEQLSQEDNPIVAVRYDDYSAPIIAFSKVYAHVFNPQRQYIAIMVCNSADVACPVVLGADSRCAITYIDPKFSDNSDKEFAEYLKTSRLILTEMKYVFSQVDLLAKINTQ